MLKISFLSALQTGPSRKKAILAIAALCLLAAGSSSIFIKSWRPQQPSTHTPSHSLDNSTGSQISPNSTAVNESPVSTPASSPSGRPLIADIEVIPSGKATPTPLSNQKGMAALATPQPASPEATSNSPYFTEFKTAIHAFTPGDKSMGAATETYWLYTTKRDGRDYSFFQYKAYDINGMRVAEVNGMLATGKTPTLLSPQKVHVPLIRMGHNPAMYPINLPGNTPLGAMTMYVEAEQGADPTKGQLHFAIKDLQGKVLFERHIGNGTAYPISGHSTFRVR